MKKIFIVLATATLGFSSCSDFLDKAPLEELSDASFWKTVDDAKMFTGDIYNSLPSYNYMDGDVASDDVVHGIKWAEGNTSKGIYLPTDFGWGGEYGVIRKCNMAIEKVELVPNISEEDKNMILAEARALRGYFYFQLMQAYGDVPYTDKTLTLDELQLPRTPIAEVYAKTKADLEFAASILPANYDGKNKDYGRITAGAALTILMDMQNYFASFPATDGGLTYGFVTYAEAAATAKKVIDLGVFDLWDEGNVRGDYEKMFWSNGDGDNEFIFVRTYKRDAIDSGLLTWGSLPGVGWGGINPTQSLVDAFEDSEGALLKDSKIYDPKKPFENRDPRLKVNVLGHGQRIGDWVRSDGSDYIVNTTPGSPSPTGIGSHRDATATGYYQYKHIDRSLTFAQAAGSYFKGEQDACVYRFAEVLITYAEALTEANKAVTPEALDALNRVRARVGQPELQSSDASKPTYVGSYEDMRERVRNEYRVELAIEGKRLWSIRRFRDSSGQPMAMKVMNEPILGVSFTAVDGQPAIPYTGEEQVICRPSKFEMANMRYPIPQSEIDINDSLTQNEGY